MSARGVAEPPSADQSAAIGHCEVSLVSFTGAPATEQGRGLVGWAWVELRGLVRIELALRRTLSGRLALSFPASRDGRGQLRARVRPSGDEARLAIEAAVIDALRAREVVR